MTRWTITAVLALGGAVVGGLATAILISLLLVAYHYSPFGPDRAFFLGFTGIAAAFGALCGGVLAPSAGWLLLRRVPLARAAIGTAVGTIFGGALGEWLAPLNPYAVGVPGILVGAVCGFTLSALLLSLISRRTHAAAATPSNEEL
jgi:hypothetical protein